MPAGTTKNVRGSAFSPSEVEGLLNVVGEVLPTGADQWSKVAEKFNGQFRSRRTYEDLRNKFKRLRSTKKPTGVNESCHEAVIRAKLIHNEIETSMGVEELCDDGGSQKGGSSVGGSHHGSVGGEGTVANSEKK